MGPIELFWTFLKASALGSGGHGSLPLLREDLILPGHATNEQLVQALAVGKISTGPNGTYVVSLGYFVGGVGGAVAALLAALIPPLLMVPLVAVARRHLLSPRSGGFVRGATLATAGMLLATSLALLGPPASIPAPLWQVPAAIVAAALTYQGRVHPALLILAGAALGVVLARG